MVLGKLSITSRRMKLDPSPYTEINPKWIKYLNIRPENLKLLHETWKTLEDMEIGNCLSEQDSNCSKNKEPSTDRWDCIKFKNFCTVKETIMKIDNLHNGRKPVPVIH
jgi:hypothetical protein